MSKNQVTYLSLLGIHVLIGVIVYIFRPFGQLYFFGAIGFFLFLILRSGNKNNEALLGAAYMVGGEVFFRMIGAAPVYETGKYSVIAFLFIGLLLSGTSRKSGPYWLYLFLLLPGILVSAINLNFGTDVRNAIIFNLSGPFCLGLSALYCVDRRITYGNLKLLCGTIFMPIVAMASYLTLYTPDLRSTITGTGANFAASGGFGPNQVSTVLGLGIFLALIQLITNSRNKGWLFFNLAILGGIFYRAVVTFSRGGVITAIIISILFLALYFYNAKAAVRGKLSFFITLIVAVITLSWGYTSFQTGGLIDKRYANQDARGRVKDDVTTGRAALLTTELTVFYENPVVGVGVGKIREYREELTGTDAASHNELSRMLSEHGILGLIMLGILGIYPLIYRASNTKNLLFYSALGFWFLTINHSSMRIAAPAFIYALSLLNVVYEKKNYPVRRQRALV